LTIMYDKYIIFVKTKIYSLEKEDNDNVSSDKPTDR
jgi:hypothetical protein